MGCNYAAESNHATTNQPTPVIADRETKLYIMTFGVVNILPKPPWPVVCLEDDSYIGKFAGKNIRMLCSHLLQNNIILLIDRVQLCDTYE
jgi:hypothetical protein